MLIKLLTTYFAPAERSSEEELTCELNKILSRKYVKDILDAMPGFAGILNKNRQIVYINKSMMKFLNITDPELILGCRPGEAVRCEHHDDNMAGCGTGTHCATCGAVMAVLESQNSKTQAIKECRIITKDNTALDLSVCATHLEIEGSDFTVFSIKDISEEKRKKALERIFFHDVINTAASLKGFSHLISQMTEITTIKRILPQLQKASDILMDQINEQKDLSAAESGDLELFIEPVASQEILQDSLEILSEHSVAKDKFLILDKDSEDIIFNSCKTTLKRIMINLIKNALEASDKGKVITAGCNTNDKKVVFWVHNSSVIQPEVQMQIFQRSFSTKGKGRGLGTYSVKLLTNKYLKGKVSFTSNEKMGTKFFVCFDL